jgi:SAM-dependent methyltransferase
MRCGSTFIHRTVGIVLEELNFKKNIRVYELSSRGALFRYLRRRYPELTFSEYYDDIKPGEFKNGIQCQDIQSLTYENESFDLVTSTEVFEHVPDDLKGFREIHRVLKRNGHFVFTVPLSMQEITVERVCLKNGRVMHLLPPQYHGDRIRGSHKVLVYRNYGKDIVSRLESVGFLAEIRRFHQTRYGITDGKVIVSQKKG